MRKTIFLAAAMALASGASAQIVRQPAPPPSLILESVKLPAGTTMLYLSGQVADPLHPLPAAPTAADYGDTRAQTVATLGKIRTLLASQGFAPADIVKMTVYVVGDPALGGKMDFAGMNEGFKTMFGTSANPNTVARTTVQVVALARPGLLVEIEAVAAKSGR